MYNKHQTAIIKISEKNSHQIIIETMGFFVAANHFN